MPIDEHSRSSLSKAGMDTLIEQWANNSGLQVNGLRLTTLEASGLQVSILIHVFLNKIYNINYF
jgi:nucleoside-diphosphate-sugar epimerase